MKRFFPFLLQIDITGECNLRCKHCRTTFGAENELSSEEWSAIISSILEEASRKIEWVALGGGEPTLRMDKLLSVIATVSMWSPRVVLLMTNGITIANSPDRLDQLVDSGINRVQISLESPEITVHDGIRGKGSFQKAIRAAQVCNERGIGFAIRMTLNQLNKGQCEEMVQLAVSLGADEVNIRKVIPVGNARDNFSVDCVSPEEYRDILSTFPVLAEKYGVFINSEEPLHYVVDPHFEKRAQPLGEINRGCPAGISYSYIDPEGRVRSCSNIPYILGDLKKENFWDIWNSHPWLKRFRKRDFAKCQSCHYDNICGGCRAMAKIATDDWWGVDPNCWL